VDAPESWHTVCLIFGRVRKLGIFPQQNIPVYLIFKPFPSL